MRELDADAVLALARERGQQWIDRETAGRIATGAAAAIRAVLDSEAVLSPAPVGDPAPGGAVRERELAAFLDELVRLGKET
jgi:hypothetical protein